MLSFKVRSMQSKNSHISFLRNETAKKKSYLIVADSPCSNQHDLVFLIGQAIKKPCPNALVGHPPRDSRSRSDRGQTLSGKDGLHI